MLCSCLPHHRKLAKEKHTQLAGSHMDMEMDMDMDVAVEGDVAEALNLFQPLVLMAKRRVPD